MFNITNYSVQFSCSVVSDSLWSHGLQHARPPCLSSTPGVYSNSCPLSGWCHPAISSFVVPFSSCLQSFPASGSFQMNHTRASHCSGFSCFRALSRAQAQQLWQMGLVATWHVGSSRTRDRTVSRELAGRFFTLKSPGKLLNSRFSIWVFKWFLSLYWYISISRRMWDILLTLSFFRYGFL